MAYFSGINLNLEAKSIKLTFIRKTPERVYSKDEGRTARTPLKMAIKQEAGLPCHAPHDAWLARDVKVTPW